MHINEALSLSFKPRLYAQFAPWCKFTPGCKIAPGSKFAPSDFFTNLFLCVPGLTRPKFFASQTRSSASHMGPTLNHKFYVSIQIRPIHTSQFEKQDTVILTYTIKSKLTLSCKIIFRAQAISLCSSNSACLQVYCWKLLSPWTYGDDTILIFVNTICSQYSPRTA